MKQAATTSVLANDVVCGDTLFWQKDKVDIWEIVVDARAGRDTIVVWGTMQRTAEQVRLSYPRDEWVTVIRREDK